MAMLIEPLAIPDLLLITPRKFTDERGFFSETFRRDALTALSADVCFVQDNHVLSKDAGVLRGLHYQVAPHEQGKLVRCPRGGILDVAVDIRRRSPTFGQHVAVELNAENWKQLWVPPGFAHGYVTLKDETEVVYKVTDYYSPECERGIAWDDPDLAIDWRLPHERLQFSPKDQKQPRFNQLP